MAVFSFLTAQVILPGRIFLSFFVRCQEVYVMAQLIWLLSSKELSSVLYLVHCTVSIALLKSLS